MAEKGKLESESCDSLEIKDYIKKRGTIRGRITVFGKYIESLSNCILKETQIGELNLRIKCIEELFLEFNSVQGKIEVLAPDEDMDNQLETRELIESQYFTLMSLAKGMSNKYLERSVTYSNNCNENHYNSTSVKLPFISLPSFDGSFDQWLEFRDKFLMLIHESKDINRMQKFHYLRSSLKGSALQVIDELDYASDNYEAAWELLLKAYNNNKRLIIHHVKALFNINSVTKESSTQLKKLIESTLKNLHSLKKLGEPTESWDTLIIHLIVTKLDTNTEREWQNRKSLVSNDDTSKLNYMLQFLRDRADMLEGSVPQTNHFTVRKPNNYQKPSQAQVHSHVSSQKQTNTHDYKRQVKHTCVLCNNNHALYTCVKFLNMSVQDRLKVVNSKEVCINCLQPGHTLSSCVYGSCKQCSKKHNSLLHIDNANNMLVKPHPQSTSSHIHTQPSLLPGQSGQAMTTCFQVNQTQQSVQSIALEPVLLSTALVEVYNNNICILARTLLDSGSQCSFITQSLCKKLCLEPVQSTLTVTGIGNTVTHSMQTCTLSMKSRINNYTTNLSCSVLPQITSNVPNVTINVNALKIPETIILADPHFYTSADIDLLLGAEVFWDLLQEGRLRLSCGPYLQNTVLGWIISGTLYNDASIKKFNNQAQCNFTTKVDEQLKRFWLLEEVDVNMSNNILTKDEQYCEQLFTSTTSRDTDGRFTVKIPLRESVHVLGESYDMAKNRFLSLERKLDRAPKLKQTYCEFLDEYLALGHMTRIETYNTPHYFIPHHCVQKDSTTTKLRVVFDAGAQTTTGKSFNDIQYIGPPLLNDIIGILLRFRQYAFVVCADIEKMYRQVLIHPELRTLQLILWRPTNSQPINIYQLNTVTYGTAAAPYLAMRCLRQLALECSDVDVARAIDKSMYVDDLVFGCNDKNKLLSICNSINNVLKSGGFDLRKWTFNFDISCESNVSKSLSLDENAQCKTLGLGWHNNSDELHFNSKMDVRSFNNVGVTKRLMLSVIAQIYDPLGLLAPVVIVAKILLQRLWLCKINWDTPVPNDVALQFHNFMNTLEHLGEVKVPRHVMNQQSERLELHMFSDACLDAYGACAYVRSSNMDLTDVTVRLLCAKGKVAPIKPVSIPRLELCGALLAAKLCNKIVQCMDVQFDKIYLWSDSTIVLSWLRMHPNQLKPFVQNRVVEINELTNNCVWLHVSGTDNPADILSRGVNVQNLIENKAWWAGPDFLHSDNNFLRNIEPSLSTLDIPELKSHVSGSANTTEMAESPFLFENFSSFSRMVRTAAYVLRFVHNIKPKIHRKCGPLTITELRDSTLLLARLSQMQSFPIEYNKLSNPKGDISLSRNLTCLNPIFDKDKFLIRVGGRLNNSKQFHQDKKHPILLCSKHSFTQLLFECEHKKLLHAGPQLLLGSIREVWWPLGGRLLARNTVHKCVKCVRMTGRVFTPIMGNLPPERLEPGFPFLYTGTDYCGPFFILNRQGRGSKLIKCYICLFVCFATRAIHLELVTDLSTKGYLMCLKRFISRRGKPREIFSDNGKNYVGAVKEVGDFLTNNSKFVIEGASLENISFTFIPPYSPHFGGLWEAGVKSAKYHLQRVAGNANLTFEEFYTVLVQVEGILNSRPLTPLSTDPNDLQALTPAHFLIGRPLTSPATADISEAHFHRLPRYSRVEQLRQHFWSRWSQEYVAELQTRTRWKIHKDDIKIDTLVIIKEDNLPPLKWRLGRVVQLFPGTDGIARVATIRTSSGEIKRAFSKLCPLPLQ